MMSLSALSALLSVDLTFAVIASLGLGALIAWDIRGGEKPARVLRRQIALAAVSGVSCVVTFALAATEGAASNALLVALIAGSVVALSAMAVRALLRPARLQSRFADKAASATFAVVLGASLGFGLAHVAGVIVPAALLFLNLMRWNAPQAARASAKLS